MKRYKEISDSNDETLWDPDVPVSALTMFNYCVLWGKRARTQKINRERRRCGIILTRTAKLNELQEKCVTFVHRVRMCACVRIPVKVMHDDAQNDII